MDGVAGPTVVKFEEGAEIVVQKGSAKVELHADGSVYVNGAKVVDPAVNNTVVPPAPVAATPTPDAVVTPPVDTTTASVADAETAPVETAAEVPVATADQAVEQTQTQPAPQEQGPSLQEQADAARAAAVKQAIKDGQSFTEATEVGEAASAAVLASGPLQAPTPIPMTAAVSVGNGETSVATADATTLLSPMEEAFGAGSTIAETQQQPAAPVAPVVPAGPAVGETVEGKGVFVGIWQPIDENGKSLGKIFNVYAAPEDLTDDKDNKVLLSFNDAAKRVGTLKGWNGYDGGNFENEEALIKSLRKGKYNGEWFIPTLDIVTGGESKQGLFQAQSKGDLDGTFEKVKGSTVSKWYWTCTETPNDEDYVQYVRFDAAEDPIDYMGRANNKLATRPVRLELRP